MMSTGRIGLILPEITDPLDYEFVNGIYDQASELGYDLIIYTGIYNSQEDLQQDYYIDGLENIYSLIYMNRLDGIIFAAERFHNPSLINKIYSFLSHTKTPVLTLGYKKEGFPYINAKQYDSIYKITKHLIDIHNCRHIYCLAGVPGHEPSEERLKGFLDAMADSGLKVNDSDIFYGCYWTPVPEQLAKDIADGKIKKPDAVVCLNEVMAICLCDNLMKNGINIPNDIAITGNDGEWYSFMNNPQITTVTGRDGELGITAVCRLYEMIHKKKCRKISRPQEIRYGTSCGCGYDMQEKNSHLYNSIERHLSMRMKHSVEKHTFLATDFINKTVNATSVEELFDKVDCTGHIIKYWNWLDIALCEDWKINFQNPDAFRHHGHSEKMYLALSKRYGTNEKSNYLFDTADIIPALNNPHETCVILLTSLHCKGQIFGYVASSYNSPNDIELDMLYTNWCDSVANGLMNLQRKLHLNYFHKAIEEITSLDPLTNMLNSSGFTNAVFKNLQEQKIYIILMISFIDNPPSDNKNTMIGAGIIKKICQNEICTRFSNDVFGIVLFADNNNHAKKLLENFLSELNSKINTIISSSKAVKKLEYISDKYIICSKNFPQDKIRIQKKINDLSKRKKDIEYHQVTYREELHSLRRKIISQPEIDWNLTDICKNLNISKGHLQRLYKELFLVNLKDDIIDSRILKAKHLLANTNMRIQEIAISCGYRSTEHFSRQFREKVSLSPKDYRKNQPL